LANHPRYNAVTYRTLPLTPPYRLSSSHISLASPVAADSVPMLSQPQVSLSLKAGSEIQCTTACDSCVKFSLQGASK
jgi:hypothetical protein